MRDKMLGRWAVRLAVTIGAGSLALGASAAAASASTSHFVQDAYASVPGAVSVATVRHVAAAGPEPIYVTEDFSWG